MEKSSLTGLDEHENPGEATVQVLHGRVKLATNSAAWEGSPGDLLTVPDTRHTLEALQDAAVQRRTAHRRERAADVVRNGMGS